MSYIEIIISGYKNYFNYLVRDIFFQSDPWYINYFWTLILFSVGVYIIELLKPWRKSQKKIRKDFWLDLLYMFFNYFIFRLIFFASFILITLQLIKDLLGSDLKTLALININGLPFPLQLIIFFLIMDLVQWLTHISLHRYNFLWNFHKVHHSVEEMGFAAHLRFHWMENVIYTPIKYITLMLIGGFEPEHVFIIYYITTLIGHLNHSNIKISYGPLKYIFNNPVMHIWHHSKKMGKGFRYGTNFGISLSLWDYIFKTAYMPGDGRDIKLGFHKMDKFPKGFAGQQIYPINKKDL